MTVTRLTNKAPAQLQLHFLKSISEIDADTWNSLAGDGYPFIRHEFFLTLEESKCTTALTGWQPYHAVVEKQHQGKPLIIAIMPLFIKDNSTGEYVFDWSWADAYRQHGIEYYPKFVTAIPFTPSAGPRICVHPDHDSDDIMSLLATCIPEQARKLKLSSWHVLFPEKDLSEHLHQQHIQQRLGCQYQWFNHNFTDFNQFLQRFNSRKRKNIKKERLKVFSTGINFEFVEGGAITQKHWQQFYLFYQSTYFVRGRSPYLTEDFFHRIGEAMPDSLLLVMASKEGKYIAGALSFIGDDTLYGRYWGCSEEYQFLHFETCYYQGIDYCIDRGLKRFDSGAQGEHKIQRGFEPVLTYSNHWVANPDFKQAINRFLKEEEQYIRAFLARSAEYLPFKQAAPQAENT